MEPLPVAAPIVHGRRHAINAEQHGTKVAAHYEVTVPPGGVHVVRLRLGEQASPSPDAAFGLKMADALSNGIIKQFPAKFAGTTASVDSRARR
jgi:hypothetical protein